jgi:hypothetical protein
LTEEPDMSPAHFHAVIWIDHREARVFHFSPSEVDRLVLHPDNPTRHIHHKANEIGSGHAAEDHAFLHAVAQSVADAGAVLVTGPANAKTELVKHIPERRRAGGARPQIFQGRRPHAAAKGLSTSRRPGDFPAAPGAVPMIPPMKRGH